MSAKPSQFSLYAARIRSDVQKSGSFTLRLLVLMISTWYHGLEAALNIETDLAGLSSQNTVQVGYLLLNICLV